MQILGLLSVTLPATDADASRRWWAETLHLPPAEDDASRLGIGDVELAFGPAASVSLVTAGLEDGPQRLVDPAGTVVDLAEPDVAAAQQAEASISDFVTRADDLPGPQVDDLADQVSALVEQTRDQIGALLDGVPHNKVLAVQLALGQRARTPATEDQWPLHAASTLMSGFVIGGATSGRP